MKRARDPDELRRAMATRDLTHRELARLVECSVGTLQLILDGKPALPERARRIARSLRRPLGDLFVDITSTERPSIVAQKAIA